MVKIHLVCVLHLILLSTGIFNVIKCSPVQSHDNVSLSDEVVDKLQKLNDADRLVLETRLKKEKYYRTYAMGYVSFQCAVNDMKAQMEMAFPAYRSSDDYFDFTYSLKYEMEIPIDLKNSIDLFSVVESHYPIDNNHRAPRKIRSLFYSMYAFLTRCYDPHYSWVLSEQDMTRAHALRAAVLKFHELTDEEKNVEEILKQLREFSSSYARVRHGAHGLFHIYQKSLRSKKYLPELLYNLGILQAWNFSTEDLQNVNIIRTFLDPNALRFSAASYSFEVVNITSGEKVPVAGILPYINPDVCPRFAISL